MGREAGPQQPEMHDLMLWSLLRGPPYRQQRKKRLRGRACVTRTPRLLAPASLCVLPLPLWEGGQLSVGFDTVLKTADVLEE